MMYSVLIVGSSSWQMPVVDCDSSTACNNMTRRLSTNACFAPDRIAPLQEFMVQLVNELGNLRSDTAVVATRADAVAIAKASAAKKKMEGLRDRLDWLLCNA